MLATHIGRIPIGVGGDRRDHHLDWRKPQRHPSGIVFDQDADKPLKRAENCTVKHHRPVFGAVFADKARVEPFGQDGLVETVRGSGYRLSAPREIRTSGASR